MKELFYLIFHFKLKKLFVERTDNTLIQFFRSVFVGGIATLFDFGMTAVVREVFIGNDTVFGNIFSNSCGFMVGLAVNFALSCIFVFSKSKYGRAKEFMSFALIGLVGLGINNLIVYITNSIGLCLRWSEHHDRLCCLCISKFCSFYKLRCLNYASIFFYSDIKVLSIFKYIHFLFLSL